MRKSFLSIAIIFLVSTAFTIGQTPEKDILGSWVIDKGSVDAMVKAMLETTRKTDPERAAKMEEQMDLAIKATSMLSYEFKDNNTFTTQAGTAPQPGTWAFSDDKKNLLLTRNGKTRKDSIIELSATRMQLFHGDRKVVTLFVRP